MSMSTQHGGGNRKPSTKAVSGAKPKQGGDEDLPSDIDATDVDAAEVETADTDSADIDAADIDAVDEAETPAVPSRPKASPRKSAPPRKTSPAGKRPAGARPAARKVAPVKVKQGTAWGAIALFSVVGLLALGIVGFAVYQVHENGLTYKERADRISGIQDYFKINPALTEQRNHKWGPITYDKSVNPPVAGDHNYNWQRCQGDVYPAAIANEHALHALEHGAVWITYRPDLPADQVEQLAKKVRGNDFMLMSPYPGLDKPISLQAWGFQLKLDKASDSRIDEFVTALRQNATQEPGTSCSSGSIITETGTTPRDLGKDSQGQQTTGG